MTTDELRAKFEAFHGMSWDDTRALPVSDGTTLHLQNAYKHDFEVWQAAHASRDAEVEALKQRVGNVVRQMKDCATDISQTSTLTGQWVADTINWFVDEIGVDSSMRDVEIESTKKDTERLNWLEGQREAYGFENYHEGNRWVLDGPFNTARQAIDAAMREEGDERS